MVSFTTTQFIAMQLRCDAAKKKRLNVAPEPKTHDIKPYYADNSRQAAKLESDSCHAPLEAKEVQRSDGKRFLVSVTSFRKRLIDPDNLAAKYHLDLCRYSGALPDDSPDHIEFKVSQQKVNKGEAERTEITITPITTNP